MSIEFPANMRKLAQEAVAETRENYEQVEIADLGGARVGDCPVHDPALELYSLDLDAGLLGARILDGSIGRAARAAGL
jgi:hypothetical protein